MKNNIKNIYIFENDAYLLSLLKAGFSARFPDIQIFSSSNFNKNIFLNKVLDQNINLFLINYSFKNLKELISFLKTDFSVLVFIYGDDELIGKKKLSDYGLKYFLKLRNNDIDQFIEKLSKIYKNINKLKK